mmetsp:Transcript_30392/g.65210  ORF Transcript_30392/g.65210 Transcript_30392/m.65210 type:complete len:230 (+) Transcript_30392:263-952(+)
MQAPVKQKGWFLHTVINLLIIICFELIPLRHDTNSMRSLAGLVRVFCGNNKFIQARSVVVVDSTRVCHFGPHVFTGDLWIIDLDLGIFLQKVSNDEHRGCFSDITRVLLEGVSQDRNLFSGDRVEHCRDDFLRESLFLEIIHCDDLSPIIRARLQSIGFAQVNKVKNIFLEARPSKSHGRLQKALSNPIVHTNRTADFGHIGTRNFAQRGNGVDRRNTLCQECVCHQFG